MPETSRSRYVVECVWSGYRPSSEALPSPRHALRFAAISTVQFTERGPACRSACDRLSPARRWRKSTGTPACSTNFAVARTRVEGTWAAYVDAVPGNTHSAEFQAVLENGAKLIEPIARALFPQFKEVPYAH